MRIKLIGILIAIVSAFLVPQLHAQTRTAVVHLFEWSWNDIAQECEQHLGPKGFAAVQVSPPQKSIDRDEWWSRYQPLSYAIEGRGGTRSEFTSMVNRCAAVGVDIYVDAVINHMAALDRNYPEVPYGPNDFHQCTTGIDYNNRFEVQFCDLVGLNDLKTESDYVRGKIAEYMNDLINLGVKGFRIDASKHMPTGDIANILSRLNQPVYIFQEVIGAAGQPVTPFEYTGNGNVTEFQFERTMGFYFKGRGPLKDLRNLNTFNGWLASSDAVVFVSNHDDQRQNTFNTLTYKDSNALYELGEIFSLAYPYGYPKVMSSYFFDDHDQGPPANGANSGDACGAGWVCEHRWRGIVNMVGFRNATINEFRVTDWWDNGNNQIAFGRGGLGFVAINREDNTGLNQTLQTGMPSGTYCDVVNGDFDASDNSCSGPSIIVNSEGLASFSVASFAASAIHVDAKISDDTGNGATWQNAYFRGTPNAWSTTAMTFSAGLWRTTQTFAANESNPRFKIARFTNWTEAHPNQDFLITDGPGTYTITFNDVSKEIAVSKQTSTNPGTVDVSFSCNNGTTYMGQSVYAVGNIPELGNWSPANAALLGTNANGVSYPTWRQTITVHAATAVEWKCLKREENNPNAGVQWQSGSNNSFNSNNTSSTEGSF